MGCGRAEVRAEAGTAAVLCSEARCQGWGRGRAGSLEEVELGSELEEELWPPPPPPL